jgi:hypothetical protein
MNYLLAALLALHGALHGLGFVSSWRLGRGVPLMSPTLLGSVAPDGTLMRALGLLWLLPVAGFGLAAVGLALGLPVTPLLAASALLSLSLCVLWWNDARVGFAVDIAIIVGLVLIPLLNR